MNAIRCDTAPPPGVPGAASDLFFAAMHAASGSLAVPGIIGVGAQVCAVADAPGDDPVPVAVSVRDSGTAHD